MRMDFYVYALLDPLRPGPMECWPITFLCEPFYIGKGLNRRTDYHRYDRGNTPKANRWRTITESGAQPIIMILADHLTEDVAHALERAMIAQIGRADLRAGPLMNVTAGGQGTSGRKVSATQRQRMSDRQLGIPRPDLRGQKRSDETREKLRRVQLGRVRTPEHRAKISISKKGRSPAPNKGKQALPHVVEAMRKGHRLWAERNASNRPPPLSAEEIQRRIKASQFKPGHVNSPETIAKVVLAQTGRIKSLQERANISKGKKGKPNLKLRGKKRDPAIGAKISATKKARKQAA